MFVSAQIHVPWNDANPFEGAFWDTGSREENNVSATASFSDASKRIFSEEEWEGVRLISAATHSTFYWKLSGESAENWSLNSACCVNLAESRLSWSLGPRISTFSLSEQEVLRTQIWRWALFSALWQVAWMSALAQGWFMQLWCSWLAAAVRAARDSSCQPEALKESQESFASERTVATNMSCSFCTEEDASRSAAQHPVRLLETSQEPWQSEAQFSIVKNQVLYLGFLLVHFFKTFCSKN